MIGLEILPSHIYWWRICSTFTQHHQMNRSFFNSNQLIPKSLIDGFKPDFNQGLMYNFNHDQLTAIALRLAHFFPWQNVPSHGQYLVPPYSNLNSIFLWPIVPKAGEEFQNYDFSEQKDLKISKGDDSNVHSVESSNEAINLKILALPISDVNSNYPSTNFSDQDEKMSKISNSSTRPEKSTQSGRKRRKSGFQTGVTVGYTYEAFFVSDGRSKKKKFSNINKYNLKKGKKEIEPTPAMTVIEDAAESSAKIQRFICCECGKNYATSSNLSRHKQTHRTLDSQQARKCPHCDKIYVSMPALSMHILTHDLRHQCDICGKAFSRPWLLQGHRRAHTGEKPYGCAHCGRAFADRSNLRAHMQTHSSMKTYECNICKRNFALKSYLNKHLESSCCINP